MRDPGKIRYISQGYGLRYMGVEFTSGGDYTKNLFFCEPGLCPGVEITHQWIAIQQCMIPDKL